MTKQEFIKSKWEEAGMDFDLIKDNVNENGWHKGDVDLIPEGVYQNCDHYSKDLGKMAERPKLLRGIEQNNGWIKIEEKGNPLVSGVYLCIDSDFFENEVKMFFNGSSFLYNGFVQEPTHWRPVVEIPKPLY